MSSVLRLVDRSTGEVTFEGRRVTNRVPCPVCAQLHKHQSWCLIDQDRGLVICPRVESRKKIGEAGWLHAIDGKEIGEVARFSVKMWSESQVEMHDFGKMQNKLRASITFTQLTEMSKNIGVSRASLESFGIGWDGRCWSFPMWSRGVVCGIRLRAPDKKFCVTGSRLGLFLPKNGNVQRDGDLFICEGESDAAAMTDRGFVAVGRPGCKLAVADCCSIATGRDVIIARDNDPAGKAGASELALMIRKDYAKSASIIAPPTAYKDFRAWINDGAQQDDIQAIVKARRGW
jgi:hypothetical protein